MRKGTAKWGVGSYEYQGWKIVSSLKKDACLLEEFPGSFWFYMWLKECGHIAPFIHSIFSLNTTLRQDVLGLI